MRTSGFLSRAQMALGIGYLALFVGFSLWARFEVPYRDDWDWMLSSLTGPGGLAGFLLPHNEHVIPLARLMMSAQLVTGGVSGHLIYYVALGCQLAVIWMFWREVGRRWPAQPSWRATVGGLVLVCLSLTQQLQSIVFAAAVLFPLVQFWATLAVVAWLNAEAHPLGSRQQQLWRWCSVACVAGAVASTTSGIIVPLVLGAMASLRRGRGREVAAWVGVTVALVVAYVSWVGLGVAKAGAEAAEQWAPPTFGGLISYALAVLSAGAPYAHVGVALTLGAIVLAAVTSAMVTAVRRRSDLVRVEMFAFAQILFGLACTVMVAPGRAQLGLLQAAQSRYATFVLCVWAGLLMFFASRSARAAGTDADNAKPKVLWGAMALSVVLLVPNVYTGLLWWAKADNLNAARLALRSGVLDPVWLKTLHPLPVVVADTLVAMEWRGVSVVDAMVHTTVFPVPTATCPGEGRLTSRSRAGGMVFDGRWSSSLIRGVVIDAVGVVVGLTEPSPWVRAPAPSPSQVHAAVMRALREAGTTVSSERPWIGFAQAGSGGPYRWLGSDDAGAWLCTATLTLATTVYATLDRVDLAPGNVLRAAGWAFACGEPLAEWTLQVDGQPVDTLPVERIARATRPDVQAAFADGCAPDEPAGVHLQALPGPLSPGPHTATLRVVSASGAMVESVPISFVAPPGGAR